MLNMVVAFILCSETSMKASSVCKKRLHFNGFLSPMPYHHK